MIFHFIDDGKAGKIVAVREPIEYSPRPVMDNLWDPVAYAMYLTREVMRFKADTIEALRMAEAAK